MPEILCPTGIDLGTNFQACIAIGGIQGGFHKEILERQFRLGKQHDLPVNAAEAPHVLVLQVASVAPAEDLNGQPVFPGLNIFSDIEFGREPASLAVTHLLSVHPAVECRTYPAKVQDDPLVFPSVGKLKIPVVGTHRIIPVDIGWMDVFSCREGLQYIRRKWIGRIGVDGLAVSFHFPVGGYGNILPAFTLEIPGVKVHGPLLIVFHETEFPLPVQADHPGPLPVTLEGILNGGIGIGCCPRGQLVDLIYSLVLPVFFLFLGKEY